ncbi:MAG: hypothetical protein ACYCZX_19215 [Rhodospirillaceae bacterium]
MANTTQKNAQENQGEGNRTAAKVYNEATTRFAKSGKVDPAARKAEKSLETPEAEDLAQAEAAGRRPRHGEKEV